MDLGLSGKRAFVAGSSRGLGYALALGLAHEGCAVAINSRNPTGIAAAAQEILASTQSQVVPLPGDITDPQVPNQLIQQNCRCLVGWISWSPIPVDHRQVDLRISMTRPGRMQSS
jgi:NAD(P)-dependent dehydrogenase (short-subunit alcohol dehydrogenase family)